MTATFTLDQLFKPDEGELIIKIYNEDEANFVSRVQAEIVEPALERINKITGQQNDPRYIAYMLLAAAQRLSR